MNLLIVDFDVRTLDQKVLVRFLLNGTHKLIEYTRDYAFLSRGVEAADHGVGFPRACLAISKNSSIIAFDNLLNQRLPC